MDRLHASIPRAGSSPWDGLVNSPQVYIYIQYLFIYFSVYLYVCFFFLLYSPCTKVLSVTVQRGTALCKNMAVLKEDTAPGLDAACLFVSTNTVSVSFFLLLNNFVMI